MATWKNLDTLASYSKLAELKGHVNIADAMAGEKGAERVKKYSTPMAAGLTYNYAAKQVDETVLDALAKLADEAELIDKFQELYNGAVINTGEKRMVLHHLARTQLGEDVVVDGVTNVNSTLHSRRKPQTSQIKFTQVRLLTKTARNSQLLYRSVSVEVI
mgnify:CR=1 FL=1